ncbi:MAG: ABC transporter ATP-binding protein, partial [Oscillibacter sp.]|nr:ABC transporter ATP-binding protein [Oscillibacter sp.]
MAENKRPIGPPPGKVPGGPGPRGGFQKPKDLKATISKLMRYLGRYKVHLCVVAVLLVVSSVCSVGGSFLIKPLINDYILPGDFPGLAGMLVFMAAVYITGAACSYGYARIMVHVSQNTVARIREELCEKMQRLPLKFFDTHTHGELMSRYTNDIETVSEALNNSFGSLI